MATNYAIISGVGGAIGVTTNNTTVYSVGFSDNNLYALTPNSKSIVTNLGFTGYMLANDGDFLYITSYNSSRLVRYHIPSNTITSTLSLSFQPTGIALNDQYIFISDYDGGKVVTVNMGATLSIANQNYITGLQNPIGLTFDNTNALWICEYSGNKVSKYSGAGGFISSFTINNPTSVTYNSNNLFISSNTNNLGSDVFYYNLTDNTNGLFSNTPSPYQTLFYNNYFYAASYSNSSVYTYTYTIPCYHKNTKILCLKGNNEEYISISEVKKDDLVKIYSNDGLFNYGFKKIELIGSRNIIGNNSKTNKINDLFKCKDVMNGFEPLIVTGGHSILVDSLNEQEKAIQKEYGFESMIEDKHLLMAMASDKFEQIIPETNEVQTVYHLVLENSDDKKNYGIWANGILSESCSKDCFLKYLANQNDC